MYNNNSEAEDFEDSRGLFARWKDRLMGHDEYDEDEDIETEPSAQSAPTPRSTGGSLNPLRRAPLRMDHARRTHVTVRRAVQSFDDAKLAADGLKDGQQQIINLEQTPNDMAVRIIDFLNGATHALDGSVEKIGDQVYLFTPCSVTIDVEEKPAPVIRSF